MKKLLFLISILFVFVSLNAFAGETEVTPEGADLCADPKTPKAEVSSDSIKEETSESSVDSNK